MNRVHFCRCICFVALGLFGISLIGCNKSGDKSETPATTAGGQRVGPPENSTGPGMPPPGGKDPNDPAPALPGGKQ